MDRQARLYDAAKTGRREGGVLVVVNPTAFGGAAGRRWPLMARHLERHFPSFTVRTTAARGDAERWAAEWTAKHPDQLVVAVGGDGTVHDVVNGLLRDRASARLGIIPAGTGNDIARNAGVPTDPEAAVERLARDQPMPMDAGRLRFQGRDGVSRSRIFLNSASVGVSPRANHIAGNIRRVLPGRICYALGGIAALIAEGAGRYVVTAAGRTLHSGPALNITLANGPSFGGGMRISPASSVSDGRFDQVLIGDIGRIRALIALSRLYAGTHVRMPGVSVTPVKETVQIRREDGAMLIEADGEEFEATGELTVEVLPGAVQLS